MDAGTEVTSSGETVSGNEFKISSSISNPSSNKIKRFMSKPENIFS